MSDAQAYYEGLIGQGYSPDQATEYTKQHYADFGGSSAPPDLTPPTPVPYLNSRKNTSPEGRFIG